MTNATKISAPEGMPFLDLDREFDAPVAAVYRIATDPKLVAQWIGPREISTEIVEYDVRPGGAYRYRQSMGDEFEVEFHGVYHTVVPNEMVINTFEFNGAPGLVTLENATYEDLGDRTRMFVHTIYPSVESRDAALASGMEEGIRDSHDRMEEFATAQ